MGFDSVSLRLNPSKPPLLAVSLDQLASPDLGVVELLWRPIDVVFMDERAALRMLAADLPAAGDDAAVVGDLVITTDMLHEATDFPVGTTRYTAGWRAVGASLSDVAAMGASALAAVAIYGAPSFDREDLQAFLRGVREVCEEVEAEYVGGDLDRHDEFTVATTAIGRTETPVFRQGAQPGDVVCVTGTLGRTAAALALFEQGDTEAANALFRFTPRIQAGRAFSGSATAMIDSSDGLARSLHQLSEASSCGFAVDSQALPVDDALHRVTPDADQALDRAVFFGEDFELIGCVPPSRVEDVAGDSPVDISVIGEVTEAGVEMDGDPLLDRGYTH